MTSTDTATELWDKVRSILHDSLPGETYEMWFSKIEPTKVDGDYVELLAPNEFSAIWIQDNFMDLVNKEMSLAAGRTLKVSLVSPEQMDDGLEQSRAMARPATKSRLKKLGGDDGVRERVSGIGVRQAINPRNTFENFVVGPGSQLAQAACVAVANSPA
ncbi:MAG: DnaA N-terminal domain-containing protein, partial [Opitutales bacterium]